MNPNEQQIVDGVNLGNNPVPQGLSEEQIQAELDRYSPSRVGVASKTLDEEAPARPREGGTGEQPPTTPPEQPPATPPADTPPESGETTSTEGATDEAAELAKAETERANRWQTKLNEATSQRNYDLEDKLKDKFRTLSAQEIADRENVELEKAEMLRRDQERENTQMIEDIKRTSSMLRDDEIKVYRDFKELDRESKEYDPALARDFDTLYREYQSAQIDRHNSGEIYRANSPYNLAKAVVEAKRRGAEESRDKWIAEGAKRAREQFNKANSSGTAPKASPGANQPPAPGKSTGDDMADKLLSGLV